ncbi:MAG: mycothiol synthase [Propionibacteriaceae bacterium]|jgi:mycothiol synthase|nr:mycothiol synthase [Propionibacteriaceae bacterium]
MFIEWLNSTERSNVAALARHVEAADGPGNSPLSEQGYFNLHEQCRHLLHWQDGQLAGYLQHDTRMGTAQLMVAPEFRRRGIATAMLAQLGRQVPVWAFGNLPPAQALAAKLDYRGIRELLVMERALGPGSDSEARLPDGFTVRGYREADLDALAAVNAAAFAHHPEQGRMTAADFRERMAESWFDPAGLLLVFAGGRLAGFHWTKRETPDRGEVYVIGVAEWAQGQGLGRALLDAGLDHLRQQGVQTVFLYVDASEEKPVRMYDRAGFEQVHRDVLWEAT